MKRIRLRPGLITDSWELKLTALGLSVLLWAAVKSEATSRFTMRDVPVEVRVTDGAWVMVGGADPATVDVDVRGPVRELIGLAFAQAMLVVPVDDVEDTVEVYRTRAEWLEYGGRFENLRVDEMEPAALRLRFQPLERRMVPVAVRLANGLQTAARPVIEPAHVLVEGRRDYVAALDSVVVRVSDLAAVLDGSVRLPLDSVRAGVRVRPIEVDVHFEPVPEPSLEAGSGIR